MLEAVDTGMQAGAELGPYRLLRRIGSGGMAEVFLAHKLGAEGFQRTVAIKTIIALGAEEEAIGLFLDEAKVAAVLNHANIVQTLDLGYENETLFIVMEFIQGPALSRILREVKKNNQFLDPAIVAYTGARVAASLDFAHNRATAGDGQHLRLVHRDISPQNIMLTRAGTVKLSDFGVARASIQTHKTRTGQVRGKAAYMAPEQVRAKTLDGRTDIFALGLVLYEALTCTRAYQRSTDIQAMRAILTDPVAPIESINPAVPKPLIDAVMRALEKSPDRRFQTAGEMQAALEAAYRGTPDGEIEQRIRKQLETLFGPPGPLDEDGLPNEPWQPVKSQQSEAAAPMRIGQKLSPEIAKLLEEPAPAPRREVAPHLVFEHEGTPAPQPSVYTPTPAMIPTPTPVILGTPTGYVGGNASFSGTHPGRSLAKIGLPLLGVLILAVGALGWSVLNRPTSEPAPMAEKSTPPPEVSAQVVTPVAKSAAEIVPEIVPQPQEPIREPPREVIRPVEEPRTKRVVRAEPPPPPPPPPPAEAPSPEQFKLRVFSAKKKAEASQKTELAQKLSSLLNSLALRPPNEADRALLKEAERALE